MDTRKEKFPHGIPGHNLGEIEREIPINEPPAWPVNEKLKTIGKRVKRIDAIDKVTGKAKYTSDMKLPGMLYAKMLRSTVPHAEIRSIDISRAQSLPGVYAIHLVENKKEEGENKEEGKYPSVKYVGQPLGGVAAESLDIAKDAISMIKVTYDTKPFVIDVEEAMTQIEILSDEAYAGRYTGAPGGWTIRSTSRHSGRWCRPRRSPTTASARCPPSSRRPGWRKSRRSSSRPRCARSAQASTCWNSTPRTVTCCPRSSRP